MVKDKLLSSGLASPGDFVSPAAAEAAGDPLFPSDGEGFCAINDIAVAVRRLQRSGRVELTLAGGYAYEVEDTVTIHVNTVKSALEALLAAGDAFHNRTYR